MAHVLNDDEILDRHNPKMPLDSMETAALHRVITRNSDAQASKAQIVARQAAADRQAEAERVARKARPARLAARVAELQGKLDKVAGAELREGYGALVAEAELELAEAVVGRKWASARTRLEVNVIVGNWSYTPTQLRANALEHRRQASAASAQGSQDYAEGLTAISKALDAMADRLDARAAKKRSNRV